MNLKGVKRLFLQPGTKSIAFEILPNGQVFQPAGYVIPDDKRLDLCDVVRLRDFLNVVIGHPENFQFVKYRRSLNISAEPLVTDPYKAFAERARAFKASDLGEPFVVQPIGDSSISVGYRVGGEPSGLNACDVSNNRPGCVKPAGGCVTSCVARVRCVLGAVPDGCGYDGAGCVNENCFCVKPNKSDDDK